VQHLVHERSILEHQYIYCSSNYRCLFCFYNLRGRVHAATHAPEDAVGQTDLVETVRVTELVARQRVHHSTEDTYMNVE
jgi:hypothetical protein